MPKKTYHHGDLPQELITKAISLIETDGVGSLTLRHLAKTCSVSATAIYRHFANKEALLAAIATEGFQSLTQTMQQQEYRSRSAKKNLFQQHVCYVEFALDHPGYFEVMFGSYITNHQDYPELSTAAHQSYAMLIEKVKLLNLKNLSEKSLSLLVENQWALVHGLAILFTKNYLEYDKTNRRQVIESIIKAQLPC